MEKSVLKRRLVAVFIVLSMIMASAFSITLPARAASVYGVQPAVRYQEIDGWGSSLIWWAGQIGDYDFEGDDGREVREQIMELVYGEDGLDFNIARYNIGGGENPDCSFNKNGESHMSMDRNMEGFKKTEDGEYDWDSDMAQRWCVDWIEKNRDDVVLEAFSNAPPFWMTGNGCVTGNGSTPNLKADYEDNFAQYFMDVFYHLAQDGYEGNGFDFDFVNPFNESTSDWWGAGGRQEGCKFSDAQRNAVLDEMIRIMEDQSDVYSIAATDCTGSKTTFNAYTALSENIRDYVGKINYHLYQEGDDKNWHSQLKRLANQEDKKIWMSEMGYDSEDNLDDVPMNTAFRHSSQIRSILKDGGANAYVIWQIYEELAERLGGRSNYGPLKVSFYDREQMPQLASYGYDKGSVQIDKQYYVLGQYSKYIKAGYYITEISDSNALAAVSPDGSEVVIVRENNSSQAQTVTYNLDGYSIASATKIYTDEKASWAKSVVEASGNSISVEITPKSVTTLVLKTNKGKADRIFVDETSSDLLVTSSKPEGERPATAGIDTDAMLNNRIYYSNGWSTFFDGTNDPGARDRATIYAEAGVGRYFTMPFAGTGIEIRGLKKSDSATAVKVYIDGVLIDTIDCTQPTTEFAAIFSHQGLEKGSHVVKVEVDGTGWFNFDGFYVISDLDNVDDAPMISSAAGLNGKFYLSFSGAADGVFTLEYKTADSDWTSVAVADTEIDGGNLKAVVGSDIPLGRYYIRIKDNSDRYSGTVLIDMPKTSDMLYYVDCGDINPALYTEYESAAQYNAVQDQAYGVDPVTKKQWGRTSLNNSTYDMSVAGPYEALGTLVSGDGNTDKLVEYKFEVGSVGAFDIVVGFQNGWQDYSRNMDIYVNETKLGAVASDRRFYKFASFTNISPDAEGNLTIKITRKDNKGDNPAIGTIAIAANGAAAPLYAAAEFSQLSVESGTVYKLEDKTLLYGVDSVVDTAKVLYTDGSVASKAASNIVGRYNPAGVGISGGTIVGKVEGLSFKNNIQYKYDLPASEIYYAVDCGTDGSNANLSVGTKQNAGEYEKVYADGSWGYVASTSVGNYWKDSTYDQSIREGDGLTYKFNGFEPNQKIYLTAAINAQNWSSRKSLIYINNVKVGEIMAASNKGAIEDTYETAADAEGNIELRFTTSSYNTEKPLAAYIIIKEYQHFDDAPAMPVLSGNSGSKTDVIEVSGLVDGAQVFVADQSGNLLDMFTASGRSASIDLNDFDLSFVTEVVLWQRIKLGKSDSGAVRYSFPSVGVTGVSENWSERKVLRFTPSKGLSVSSVTVTAPNGEITDVTENMYFYYRAYQNGEYTVTLTTADSKVFSQKFTLDSVDRVDVSAAYSEDGWTKNDVNVTLTPVVASGIKSISINGEPQEVKESYTLTAEENTEFVLDVVTNGGRTLNFVYKVKNIDKIAPVMNILPQLGNKDGFIASLDVTAASGYVLTVTKGDKTFESANGFKAVEKGEYTLTATSNAGLTVSKKVNLAYDAADLKAMNVTLTTGGGVTAVNVSAKDGEISNVKLYSMGGEEILGQNGYTLSKGGNYMLYCEKGGDVEAYIFSLAFTPPSNADNTVVVDNTGCSSMAASATGFGILILVCFTAVLTVAIKRKGGAK